MWSSLQCVTLCHRLRPNEEFPGGARRKYAASNDIPQEWTEFWGQKTMPMAIVPVPQFCSG